MSLKKYLTEAELAAVQPITGDAFDISIRELTNIETVVVEHTEGSITIALDDKAINMLEECGCTFEDEQIDELAPLIGAIGRAALPLAGRAIGTLGGAALSGAGSLAGGALAGTGAAIGGAIKGARNIAKGFEDEEDEKEDDSSNFGKQLALADEYTEEEQVDELAPLRALAGIGAKMVKSPTSKAAGQVVKSVGKAIDKKVFGPRPHEEDYEESIKEQDDEEIEYQPEPGDIVQIDYPSAHEGQYGEVIELSPSGDFVYVEFKNGNIESYHSSDLRQASEDDIDQHYYGDEDFEETINSMRRLSGMPDKQTVKEMGYDKTSGGPYDRGVADSYYGRKARPHKMVPASDGVKGQMQMVSLTDPKEIAAYNAGYSENDDRKNYGEGIEDWNMSVTSIPRTEPFKLKNIVVKSPGGKTYTFDTEEDARRLFLDKWNVVKDPSSGWTVNMNNTKATDESNLAEREGDWAPGVAGLLKALGFLIGVPAIVAGQMYQKDLPIIDTPLGKSVYQAAVRGDKDAEEALNKLKDIGVQKLPMQYIEKISDKYMHESKLHENTEYQSIKAMLTEAEYRGRNVPLREANYKPGDKITWYHSNHYPKIEGTVEGWKDGHLIVKSVDPLPANTGKKVVRYRVPKNNILSHETETTVGKIDEAEYRGRKVSLGKPMQGDVAKFKVYVKDPKTGNVKKVNFGDKNMRIRKSNPGARKNFRARHNCKNPGPRTKARYWSCRKW